MNVVLAQEHVAWLAYNKQSPQGQASCCHPSFSFLTECLLLLITVPCPYPYVAGCLLVCNAAHTKACLSPTGTWPAAQKVHCNARCESRVMHGVLYVCKTTCTHCKQMMSTISYYTVCCEPCMEELHQVSVQLSCMSTHGQKGHSSVHQLSRPRPPQLNAMASVLLTTDSGNFLAKSAQS